MKKLFYLFLTLFVFVKPVCAEESPITYKKLDGIVYNQVIDGVLNSNYVTSFYLQDRIAYCIEPGTLINEKVYDIYTDWSVVNLSDEIKEYIEKVGYYGYEYPGHNTDYYYIAAQELIWKAIRPDIEVTWTTEKNLGGSVIDISKEKDDILKLVNSHSLFPSFSSNIEGYVGEEIVLEDNNNVLKYYDFIYEGNHEIIKDGNELKIKLNDNKVDDEKITFTRNYYDNEPLLVYSRGNSQKLAALRITMDKKFEINISNREKPEEIAEEVLVPDTGIGVDGIEALLVFLSGVGMIFGAIKII